MPFFLALAAFFLISPSFASVSIQNFDFPTIIGGEESGGGSLEAAVTVRVWAEYDFSLDMPDRNGIIQLYSFLLSTRCSGTLIGPRTILSAAHCFPPFAFAFGDVHPTRMLRFGVLLDDGSVLEGDDFRRHEGYRGRGYRDPNDIEPLNDLVLIHLAEDLGRSPYARIAGDSITDESIGSPLLAAGFGRFGPLKAWEEMAVSPLHSVRIPFGGPMASGGEFWAGEGRFGAAVAPESPRGVCGGDSGGPIFLTDDSGAPAELLGVIYATVGNCDRSLSLAVDVRRYADWIALIRAEWDAADETGR